jgi:protoporphyrinogen IX oxidase
MEWVKALHVISVISWMAGLLYLPRLFVYHANSIKRSEQSETFKIMERRLYRTIMTPAMAASWFFGIWMVFGLGAVVFSQIWILLKGLLVLGLTGFHLFLGRELKSFSTDNNFRGSGFFRLINEVPTVLMIGVVILVIVKPFG